MSAGHSLVLAFDTDTREFARGVEVGRLWEQLKAAPGPLEQNVKVQNAEMMLRIGEATGRTVESVELGDDWLCVILGVHVEARSPSPAHRLQRAA
jgi:hypothetical protein